MCPNIVLKIIKTFFQNSKCWLKIFLKFHWASYSKFSYRMNSSCFFIEKWWFHFYWSLIFPLFVFYFIFIFEIVFVFTVGIKWKFIFLFNILDSFIRSSYLHYVVNYFIKKLFKIFSLTLSQIIKKTDAALSNFIIFDINQTIINIIDAGSNNDCINTLVFAKSIRNFA